MRLKPHEIWTTGTQIDIFQVPLLPDLYDAPGVVAIARRRSEARGIEMIISNASSWWVHETPSIVSQNLFF